MKIRAMSVLSAAVCAGMIAQAASAQPDQGYGRYPPPDQSRDHGRSGQYDDAYRAGYRAGYQAGRVHARYDDRPTPANFGRPADGGDANQRWQRRYGQTYSYNDDRFYQQCRTAPDPGGVLAGALIGGLFGNAVSQGGSRPAATVAGVIIGGALGGALTSHMDCDDRSYAYKTYYNGFNSGRANSNWQWDNPNNGHYGDFRVGDYYTDPDGFRCATYTQQVYVGDSPEVASGRACQQPDGTWAIVN
ncbi:MAG: hypothetical protein ACHP84_19660 [Caulobacterales bacterium]